MVRSYDQILIKVKTNPQKKSLFCRLGHCLSHQIVLKKSSSTLPFVDGKTKTIFLKKWVVSGRFNIQRCWVLADHVSIRGQNPDNQGKQWKNSNLTIFVGVTEEIAPFVPLQKRGAFHSSKKRTRFLLKQKDFYKIPTKTIEIPAEFVQDSEEWITFTSIPVKNLKVLKRHE